MSSAYIRRFNIPLPETCCCLQLRTAGIIIGSVWAIPLGILCAMAGIELVGMAIKQGKIYRGKLNDVLEDIEAAEGWHDSTLLQFAGLFSCTVVLFATCALQTYGAFKQRRIFMLPFMTLLGLFVGIVILSEIIRLVTITSSISGFFVSLVLAVVGVFQLVILVSYYKQLQGKRQAPDENDFFDVIDARL